MTRLSTSFLVALLAVVPLAAQAEADRCFLFDNPEGYPVVRLEAATIDSAGTSISNRNVALVERIDASYRRGEYGPPQESDTRKRALAALIYNAETAFDYFLSLALQHEVIYSTSERDLMEAFTSRFRNPGLYPIVNLLDARAGFGRFCVSFETEGEGKREIEVTGEKMYAWTENLTIDDVQTRVVNIDMKTMSHDRVHVVYERYSCGTVQCFDVECGGQKVRVATMEDLHGQYVRKWGFHRPKALVLWKSSSEGVLPPPEEGRFVGSAIYFPHLKLSLPWFLPDLGFEDLRRFDFPEPLLTIDAANSIRQRDLEWVKISNNYRFANWDGEGDIPQFVTERFPDY
jgi:hypothetical protein